MVRRRNWCGFEQHTHLRYLMVRPWGDAIRRHPRSGELAFRYCHVPAGQVLTKTRLIRAAGLRWPCVENFEFGKDYFGLDQC
jgi:hypothetical protein